MPSKKATEIVVKVEKEEYGEHMIVGIQVGRKWYAFIITCDQDVIYRSGPHAVLGDAKRDCKKYMLLYHKEC